ncbi:thioredoxin peroxidase dot5 [Teratosphaeriaceae sp. CCFEE 6253]|nr:thioredoxin peroxidase dot5 [Teratosphaeriaceae sp. CCFEE 6253]
MPAELRKRLARATPSPPSKAAKKARTRKVKAPRAKKHDALKVTKPPASNPAKDLNAGFPDGAGGVNATVEVTGHKVVNDVAEGVERVAVARPKRGGAAKAGGKKVEAAWEEDGKSGAGKSERATIGQSITLEGFGGEVETSDGEKTTLAKLVEECMAGVVLFTYPKARTPGCTKQACLFRDAYAPLTATGFSIYGLSTDSPKANTGFKTKHSLPYLLLCDPGSSLISAIGFAKSNSATRGVFIIEKAGKVLAVDTGGPQATVDIVTELVAKMGEDSDSVDIKKAVAWASKGGDGDIEMIELAAESTAEVADSV